MSSFPNTPGPSFPQPAGHDIPAAARRTAGLVGRAGWFGFWGQLVGGAIIVTLLVLAIISRTLGDGQRTFWVGLALFTALVSLLVLAASVWLALQLTRCARRLLLPYMKPTPKPELVKRRMQIIVLVSMTGLGIGLLGTELSAVTLLAKTLAHPQGAALYSPESTLRVLDVMVILINGGLALIHFCGLAGYYWVLQQVRDV